MADGPSRYTTIHVQKSLAKFSIEVFLGWVEISNPHFKIYSILNSRFLRGKPLICVPKQSV